MYIDNRYYIENGGDINIGSAAFHRSEYRARKLIDNATQNRIQNMCCIPEAVKRLMVELVTLEAAQGAAVTENQAVASFSNDGYSETYAEPLTTEKVKEIEGRLILEYLSGEVDDSGTPLLWLGVS